MPRKTMDHVSEAPKPESVQPPERSTTHEFAEMRTAQGDLLHFIGLEHFSKTLEQHGRDALPIPAILRRCHAAAGKSQTRRLTEQRLDGPRQLKNIIREYASSARGAKSSEKLGITALESLTPQQAIWFTLRLVRHLTRYTIRDAAIGNDEIFIDDGNLRADKTDAIDLLREGIAHAEDGAWNGNGVCRQFADITTLIFDALKAMQTKGELNNIYCLNLGGWDYEEKNLLASNADPHAWNMFVAIRREETDIAIVDPTWSEMEGEELVRVDYTKIRMEGIVHEILRDGKHDPTVIASASRFYSQRTEALSKSHVDAERRIYLAWRFLNALPENIDVPPPISEKFLRFLNQLFRSRFQHEIRSHREGWRTVARHLQHVKRLGLSSEEYIDYFFSRSRDNAKIKPNDIRAGDFGLLAALVEEVRDHQKFPEELERSPRLRAFVRTVHPEMLRPFRPDRNPADLQELTLIIHGSAVLDRAIRKYLQEKKNKNTLRHLTAEDALSVVHIAENLLEQRNAEKFKDLRKTVNTWELLRDFQKLWTILGQE